MFPSSPPDTLIHTVNDLVIEYKTIVVEQNNILVISRLNLQ